MIYLRRLFRTTSKVLFGVPVATGCFFGAMSCYGAIAIWQALKGQDPSPKFQSGGFVEPLPFPYSHTSNRTPAWACHNPAPPGAQPENDQ